MQNDFVIRTEYFSFDKETFNVLKIVKNIYFITYFQFMSYFLVLFACILNLF